MDQRRVRFHREHLKIILRPAVIKTHGPVPYQDISSIYRLYFSLSRRKPSTWLGGRKSASLHPYSGNEDQVPPAVSGDGLPCPNKRTMPSQAVNTVQKRITFSLANSIQGKFCWGSAQACLLHLSLSKGRLSSIRERAGFRQEPLAGRSI